MIMKAIVSASRGSHNTQHNNQMILVSEELKSREDAEKVSGKKAIWTSTTGKKIEGIITKPHGNKGAVRVRFDNGGLPGQALGTEISIE